MIFVAHAMRVSLALSALTDTAHMHAANEYCDGFHPRRHGAVMALFSIRKLRWNGNGQVTELGNGRLAIDGKAVSSAHTLCAL